MKKIVSLILFLVFLASGLSSGASCCFEGSEESINVDSVLSDLPSSNDLPDSPLDCECPQCINCIFCGHFTVTAGGILNAAIPFVNSIALYDGYHRPIAPSPYIAGIKRPPIS